MLIGPVFTREVAIAPRRTKLYVARAAYPLALLVLMSTAWLVLTGTQMVRDVGDLARFGTILFQILAPLQLALAMFFSALLAASEVAQEKDRRTLVLLLLTNLSNSELVLGKLLASLLNVLVMLAAALPLFMLAALLGGVSFGQIARAMAVTLAAVLVCGSLGSTAGPVAREDLPGPGHDRAGLGAVAGRGRNRGRRRVGQINSAACPATPWPPASALAGDPRSRPALRPRPAGAGAAGHAGQSVPASWPWASRCCSTAWPWRWCACGIRRGRPCGRGRARRDERQREERMTASRKPQRKTDPPSTPSRSSQRTTATGVSARPGRSGTTRSSGGRCAPGPTGGRCS